MLLMRWQMMEGSKSTSQKDSMGPLHYALVAHTFPSFQRLLDKALAIEHKRVQLGDLKRKAITQGQGSSSVHPRYVSATGYTNSSRRRTTPSSVHSTGVSIDTSHSSGCPHWHPSEAYRIEDWPYMLQVQSGWALC
jgi:hypothetical protein